MADLQGFPFESMATGVDEFGNPLFDRAINAATYRGFWKKYFTNGVFFEPATNYQVTAAGGMKLTVPFGEAHVEGLTVLPGDAAQAELILPPSLTTGDRTDLIVLRVDFSLERQATVEIKEGAHDVADLQRDESVWELGLAKVVVRRNAQGLDQSDITDLRLSPDWCGLVTEPIVRTNTEAFFIQIAAMILLYQGQWADFFDTTNQAAADLLAAIQAQWDNALSGHETEWAAFFGTKRAQTEQQIAENQGLWDAFYAGITEDISALIEYAAIRLDQVVGLQAALSGLDGRITSADGQFAAEQQRVNGELSALDAAKAVRTVQFHVSVPAAAWTNAQPPYAATLNIPGLPANAKASAGLSDAATALQREMARNAMLSPAPSSASDTLKLLADGDVPTDSLPVVVTVWG